MLLDLDMCTSTIKAWQVLGVIIYTIKILVPIILIVTSVFETSKIVFSKKVDNIAPSVILFLKKLLAGILVFFTPIIIYGTINYLIKDRNEKDFYRCNKCLFFPSGNECESFVKEYNDSRKKMDPDEDIHLHGSLDTSTLHDANGLIDSDYAAIGMNGGVRIKIKNKKGISRYKIKAKDYKGKTYDPVIPENINGSYKHDYYKYTTNVVEDTYMDIKKMDHRYVKINTWLNKNNREYQFKIYGYNNSGKKEFESDWLSAIPYNVEKDAPEAEVNLPPLNTMHDPEGGIEGNILNPSANKEIDYKNRLYITNIKEGASGVKLEWENTIKDMTVSTYIVRYKEYYPDDEKRNSSIDFNTIKTFENSVIINKLTTEQEYLVQIVANGRTKSNNPVSTMVEEIVVPHTEQSRRALIKRIRRGNPYNGQFTLNESCTKAEAEAYANYGNNGKAFNSKTNYFLWFNMYQFRGYIFQKNQSDEWRLFHDFAIRIGNASRGHTPSGQYNIKGREWTDNGANGYALRYLINYQDATFGNVLHSDGVGPVMPRVVETGNRFTTAGCTIIDMPWLKFIYEYTMGSWLYNDYGE